MKQEAAMKAMMFLAGQSGNGLIPKTIRDTAKKLSDELSVEMESNVQEMKRARLKEKLVNQ